LTTKHVQRKLNNCYLNGVRNLQNVTAPTKNRLDAEEAKLVPPVFEITLRRWPQTGL